MPQHTHTLHTAHRTWSRSTHLRPELVLPGGGLLLERLALAVPHLVLLLDLGAQRTQLLPRLGQCSLPRRHRRLALSEYARRLRCRVGGGGDVIGPGGRRCRDGARRECMLAPLDFRKFALELVRLGGEGGAAVGELLR